MEEKRKSYKQIEKQACRLIDLAEMQYNFVRIDKILAIRQRYRDNISRYLGGVDLTPIGDPVAKSVQIPSRVYMGTSSDV